MKKLSWLGSVLGILLLVVGTGIAEAAATSSQSISLAPGWNVVSTPKVLASHAFSAEETSANFDIYLLDATKSSGWATMSDLGQTEFTPLYGYFINNKTGSNKTLTLNYKSDVGTDERLFNRSFTRDGWYSIGVANPSYALPVGTAAGVDINNPKNILFSLRDWEYSAVVDFTAGSHLSAPDSTAVSDVWAAHTTADANYLPDFRETKAYAVYVTNFISKYSGFQNNATYEEINHATGTVSVYKAESVASQNIAVNVPDQVLGGFTVETTGEPVTTMGMTFTVNIAAGSLGSYLSHISLVDQNGIVVAGPVDAVVNGATQTITFTDSVTFPVGTTVYTLKGRIPPQATNGTWVTLSTSPANNWIGFIGQYSGTTVPVTAEQFAMNMMLVRGASLTVSASSQPAAQGVVAGVQGYTFANIQLDASQSGEDIRISTIPVYFATTTNASLASYFSGCQLRDGTTALNTGSNVKNTITANTNNTFTLDNSLTITKGTVKTLAVKCNLSPNAEGSGKFGVNGGTYNANGVISGNSVVGTVSTSYSGAVTVAQSSISLAVDASSPSYSIVAAGNSGVTAAVYKLRAANESVTLTKLGVTLTSGTLNDVLSVDIYDGATLVGTAYLTTGNSATSSLTTPITLPKDTDKTLTLKANLAGIGPAESGTAGTIVKIDPLNAEGSGSASGNTIQANATQGVAGFAMYKTFPTLALVTGSNGLGSTGMADGRLIRFSVTADAKGPVGLGGFTFSVATTSVTVTNMGLFGYTNSSFSSPISGQGTSGQIGAGATKVGMNTYKFAPSSNAVQVPAGSTYYFELRASVSGVMTGSSVVATLKGDTATIGITTAAATTTNNFIWSGNSTTTSGFSHADWTNGYGIEGLPASGLIQIRSN